jgi:hypothetical protein
MGSFKIQLRVNFFNRDSKKQFAVWTAIQYLKLNHVVDMEALPIRRHLFIEILHQGMILRNVPKTPAFEGIQELKE